MGDVVDLHGVRPSDVEQPRRPAGATTAPRAAPSAEAASTQLGLDTAAAMLDVLRAKPDLPCGPACKALLGTVVAVLVAGEGYSPADVAAMTLRAAAAARNMGAEAAPDA